MTEEKMILSLFQRATNERNVFHDSTLCYMSKWGRNKNMGIMVIHFLTSNGSPMTYLATKNLSIPTTRHLFPTKKQAEITIRVR